VVKNKYNFYKVLVGLQRICYIEGSSPQLSCNFQMVQSHFQDHPQQVIFISDDYGRQKNTQQNFGAFTASKICYVYLWQKE
jgi:hypothetical protein